MKRKIQKMPAKKVVLTKKEEEQLYGLIENGVTLIEIVKRTGLKFGYVQKASTDYWNAKMKSKDENID